MDDAMVDNGMVHGMTHLEMAMKPEVAGGHVRRVRGPVHSLLPPPRHHPLPEDVVEEVAGHVGGVDGGPVLHGAW